MQQSFDFWEKCYNSQNLQAFNNDDMGLLWLKIKSITRREILDEFVRQTNIILCTKTLKEQFKELYNLLITNISNSAQQLDTFLLETFKKQQSSLNTILIEQELYKITSFAWGGSYNNSIDQYLIRNYVKEFNTFQNLQSKLDTEVKISVSQFVLNSWYNHWSTILIESLFNKHSKVIPAIGQIKNVDFFIEGIPFDLKVTYLPNEYLKQRRKQTGLDTEHSVLKKAAKQLGLSYPKDGTDSEINYTIIEKLKAANDPIKTLATLHKERLNILKQTIASKKVLMQWLYENQGETRFGAENRLYLVVVDKQNFEDSWKLKRSTQLLSPQITNYLTQFSKAKMLNSIVSFSFKGKSYTAISDIIFVIKN